tara:strand:- start:447 stop:929 length:483 start_codon:yes stop_codon:yes gene_type:complete
MKIKNFKTKFNLIFIVSILVGCNSEEELPPDKLIGEWEVHSITDQGGETIIWDDLTGSLIELIPEYSCMEFTATVTEQIVSTRYVFVDVNSRGCLSPAISVYTWQVNSETGFYEFTQGTNVINYLVSFSNNDNRMTWNDQTSGAITVWDRVVTTTVETTE